MNRIRLWPHAILTILGVAIIAIAGVFIWRKYEPSSSAKTLPNAARIERVEGQVAVNHSLDNTANGQWVAATVNSPISVGDRLYTRENSRSQIAFTGRNFATVDANTSLDMLDLSSAKTQVALRDGSALFDVGSLGSGRMFEVATPCGAVDFEQPGTYRIAIDNSGNANATAFSGQAEVIGQSGSATINKGEVLSVPCGNQSAASISRVDYGEAGNYLDNYYRYRYPKRYDGRYRNYYTYLDDPYYYDPARNYSSYNYVSEYIPGAYDLDDYGDWQYVSNYGYAWHPRVDTGWAPYEYGSWDMDYPYGLTWVSSEPWGYAPYHYGRWTYASNEWFWVPESTYAYPTYSPALTAFIPLGNSSVAWVALGPSDPYNSFYYDPSWQPVYYTSQPRIDQLANIYVPNAVTAIPVQDFGRVIDPRVITRVDPQTVVQYRPVLDPLTVAPLRQAAFATRQAERRIDVPKSVEQRINTPVVTAAAPTAPAFRRDLATAMRAQTIPDRVKNQKLQLNDQRAAAQQAAQQATSGRVPDVAAEQGRERQMADLARQSARGDRGARQQLQQLRQQQVTEQQAQRAVNPQGVRVGQPTQGQPNQSLRQQRVQNQRSVRSQAQPTIGNAPQAQRVRPQITKPQVGGRTQPQIQRAQPAIRNAPRAQPVRPQVVRPQPQQQRRPEPQYQRQQAKPRVNAAPLPQPKPQMERRGPPVQAKPQPQAQPRPQIQAQPHPAAQPPAQKGGAPKGGGPPAGRKKP